MNDIFADKENEAINPAEARQLGEAANSIWHKCQSRDNAGGKQRVVRQCNLELITWNVTLDTWFIWIGDNLTWLIIYF